MPLSFLNGIFNKYGNYLLSRPDGYRDGAVCAAAHHEGLNFLVPFRVPHTGAWGELISIPMGAKNPDAQMALSVITFSFMIMQV
jgi:hypothetical protein